MKYLSKILFSAVFLTLLSCSSSVQKAEAVATQFYYNVMRQDFTEIIPLLDTVMLRDIPANRWIQTLRMLQQERGAITKYNPRKVEVFKDNKGNLVVSLTYKVYYERGTYSENLLLIQRADKGPFRIIKYSYKNTME